MTKGGARATAPRIQGHLEERANKSRDTAQENIEERMRFLGFSPKDEKYTAIIHRVLDKNLDEIISDFYLHLGQFRELDRFLLNADVIMYLERVQRDNLLGLGLDAASQRYFEDRMQIGATHERIGLKQGWYLCAYVKLFDLIAGHLESDEKLSKEDYAGAISTLQRLFALDSTIGVESYYQATKDRLESLLEELSQTQKELEEASRLDELTGVSSRKYLFESLDMEIYRGRRFKHPFSLLFMDIDHFKRVNDEHGHLFGDHALREVARITRESIRPSNIVGRFGGEEFAIGLIECDRENAKVVAERLRLRIELATVMREGVSVPLTISIGIAELGSEESLEDLIRRADTALYEAKQTGRNRVCVSEG